MPTNASPPVETVAISRLFCSPTNPRYNDAAVQHVAASLRRFGWQQPIVARRSSEVIAGNTRLKAAQSLGMSEVPVWWFDGTDIDAVAFSLADNRTHEWATWNEAELAKLLEVLRAEDPLEGVGHSSEDIDALVKEAALVATDPPYLVDYTGERPNDIGKDWTGSYREIDIQDAGGFFKAVFTNVLEVLGHEAAIYCWRLRCLPGRLALMPTRPPGGGGGGVGRVDGGGCVLHAGGPVPDLPWPLRVLLCLSRGGIRCRQ